MFRSAAIATVLLLGVGAAHALELGECDDRVADRAIAGCSLLLESTRDKPSEVAHLLLRRAIAYNAKGDYDRAIADLKTAMRLTGGFDMVDRFKSDSADAHYHLGFAYEKKGERDKAISHYSDNLKSRFAHPQAGDALRRLNVKARDIDMWRAEGMLVLS
jgi:tetratricopeptide (TPR) repeat protein